MIRITDRDASKIDRLQREAERHGIPHTRLDLHSVEIDVTRVPDRMTVLKFLAATIQSNLATNQ